MMDTQLGASRRDLILRWGAATLAVGVGGCRGTIAAPVLATIPVLTVGGVQVRRVIVQPVSMGTPNLALLSVGLASKSFCKLLSGGITFRATVDLEPVAGAQPTWWGELMLVQHVQFAHQHTLAKTGMRECATSGGLWNLDGQDPYQNKRVRCGHGANSISHADDPGTWAEDAAKGPFEEVDVMPLDQFRTYLIWETTDDNRPPSGANVVHRHVLARVDWDWKAVAIDPPAPPGPPQCSSNAFPNNAWGPQATGSDVRVFLGRAAQTDPQHPGRPIMPLVGARLAPANPEAWRPGPC
jgi:hypothetical protein